MRGVRGELHLPVEGQLQAGERIIEHARKLAQLAVGVGRVDPLREVAHGDLGRGNADVPDRAEGACGNPPTAGQAEQEYGEACAGQKAGKPPYPGHLGVDIPPHQNTSPRRREWKNSRSVPRHLEPGAPATRSGRPSSDGAVADRKVSGPL